MGGDDDERAGSPQAGPARRPLPLLAAALASLAILPALAATPACARTLSPEPSGGGFVENPDHTWTLYGYGHVIEVYSAAEKETVDRVWRAEGYDLAGQVSGEHVKHISHTEAEAAEGIVERLRTGRPYASAGEREVGEGLVHADETEGLFEQPGEVIAHGAVNKAFLAGSPYAVSVSIGGGAERMMTMPAWSASRLTGEKARGEWNGHPIYSYWSWLSEFTIANSEVTPCGIWSEPSIPEDRCLLVDQPINLYSEYWNGEQYVGEDEEFRERGSESTIAPTRFNCVSDAPYPTCAQRSEGSEGLDETIGVYINLTQLESLLGETGFPAAGLGGHAPSGDESLHGEWDEEPSYDYTGEATSLSNPHVAPLADELEIAYALQSSLLPGLEGIGGLSPSAPGEPPLEVGQNRSSCGEPVSCATGNLSETQTDLRVGGRGVSLDLTRTYNSQAAAAGVKGLFGYGWSSSFSDHLILEPAVHLVVLVTSSGATVPFSESGGSFTAPPTSQDKLSGSTEAGYVLTLPSQTQYDFSGSSGRLESIADRDGNETKLAYNASTGLLETITDSAGRELTLKENPEGFVESAKDPMGHEVKYTYGNGTLATVTLPGEEKPRWSFTTDGSHQLTEMTDGRGGKTINKYNANHQIEEQTDPMKRTLVFNYETLQTKITNEATGAVTLEQFTPSGEPSSSPAATAPRLRRQNPGNTTARVTRSPSRTATNTRPNTPTTKRATRPAKRTRTARKPNGRTTRLTS